MGELLEVLFRRMLSIRSFGSDHDIMQAEVLEGKITTTQSVISFSDKVIKCINILVAKRGCFAIKVRPIRPLWVWQPDFCWGVGRLLG